MTAARTPQQVGASNRRRGHDAERAVARYLRGTGFQHAERAVRTGFRTLDRVSQDPGDITGCPGIVWSVKDCAAERIGAWMVELTAMGDPDALHLLVQRRRGHADPGRWWCWMDLAAASLLLDGATFGPQLVRMELGDVVALLRLRGYGEPEQVGA